MYSLLITLLGLESLIILAAVFTYEAKLNKLNSDYDKLNAKFNILITGESKDMQYESSGWHIDPWGSSKQPLTKEEWQKQWDANFNTEGFKKGITENQTPYVNPWSKPNTNTIYGHTPYNKDWHINNKGYDPDFE